MTRLSRRQALLGGLTLAAPPHAPKTVLADPAEPVPPINERIEALERRHNAESVLSLSTSTPAARSRIAARTVRDVLDVQRLRGRAGTSDGRSTAS